MTKISNEVKQSKLCELANLIFQYNNGEKQNINTEEYDKWVLISEELKVADIEEDIFADYLEHPTRYNVADGEIVYNKNWRKAEADKREADFNKQFFHTSLGYIRRTVTMQFSGETKDFLSDLLPAIAAGVSAGSSVKILAYDAPPFDKDVTDWTQYQHQETVTAGFIQECFAQLQADFGVLNA